MAAPRAVAIVGFKAAGKTRVVEALVTELTRRGYKVGTLKHTTEKTPLDREGTDTYRHSEAGAVSSAILSRNHTAIFLRRTMNLQRVVDTLGDIDFLILEGFKELDIAPRIIVPRNLEEVDGLRMGIEIASINVDNKVPEVGNLPVIELSDVCTLTDVVEAHAYPLLAGLNCKGCGFKTCGELGHAILAGERRAEKCVKYGSDTVLRVDGSVIPLNKFTSQALTNVVFGFIKTLKGGESLHRVELDFEVMSDA